MLYKTQPQNPVDFLGKWLLNVSQTQKQAQADIQALGQVRAAQLKHDKDVAEQQAVAKVA